MGSSVRGQQFQARRCIRPRKNGSNTHPVDYTRKTMSVCDHFVPSVPPGKPIADRPRPARRAPANLQGHNNWRTRTHIQPVVFIVPLRSRLRADVFCERVDFLESLGCVQFGLLQAGVVPPELQDVAVARVDGHVPGRFTSSLGIALGHRPWASSLAFPQYRHALKRRQE